MCLYDAQMTETTHKRLASNLRALRRQHGFSQTAFADEIDISRTRYQSYEDGRARPPVDVLIKVGEYYKMPVDVLWYGRPDESDNIHVDWPYELASV